MTPQKTILSKLLEKYERSQHLFKPGTSSRRVVLNPEKRDLSEYDYQNADVRDSFNEAARELEASGLVTVKWKKGLPVFEEIVLNLNNTEKCYEVMGRMHPKELAAAVKGLVIAELDGIDVPWICGWKDKVIRDVIEKLRVPLCCRNGSLEKLRDLLKAFREYASLEGPVTMRAFSSTCYGDTKHFEKEVLSEFLQTARRYNEELAAAVEQQESMGDKEQLAFLGIYARPELFLLSGRCRIVTPAGTIDLAPSYPYGIAVPGSLVGSIESVDLSGINRVTFIENRTNYDEYLVSELQNDELAVYLGGFMGPMKREFFSRIAAGTGEDVEISLWSDIDLGGFQMFRQLKTIIPSLKPMRMSGEFVKMYRASGLKRKDDYVKRLQEALAQKQYPEFEDAISAIIEYGVTIEQEAFLNQ